MKVTKEMIGAAHDVMLKKGDFILSAALLEQIYIAMSQAKTPSQTPFDNCQDRSAIVDELVEALEKITKVDGGTPVKTYQEMESIAQAALAAYKEQTK